MANKQTRYLASVGQSTKVGKGVSVYTGNGSNSVQTGALTFVGRESSNGRCVDSHKEREKAGHKPWQGQGDPLNRKGVTYMWEHQPQNQGH